MKRICSWCEKDMGEKCGVCGSENIVRPILVSPDAIWCADCGHHWIEGSEPISHAMCGPCIEKYNAQRLAVTANLKL